jgi:hypothetical protein
MTRRLNVLVLVMALAGCSSRASNPGADAGADAVAPGADASNPAGYRFEPEGAPGTSAAVFLRAEKAVSAGGALWLEVVAQKIGSLQGVAFRLTFDPGALEVLETEAGQAWQLSSTQNVHRFKVRPEGELWAGLGHVGTGSLSAVSPVTLARVKVRPKGAAPIKIGFRAKHNLVLDTDGTAVETRWLGGELRPVTE